MRTRSLVFTIVLFVVGNRLDAQSSLTSQTINLVERIPASPTAGALNKYFEVPVNMATGTANIQIPIYTVKSGNIVIPISLTYNSAGIKVTERAPWVGTGWSLQSVGSINKKVNGFDDIYGHQSTGSGKPGPNYPYIASNYTDYITGPGTIRDIIDSSFSVTYLASNSVNLTRLLGRIPNSQIDAEADEFFFSTPEGGGMFFYDQKGGTFISDKPNAWKIEKTFDTTFRLTSSSGLIYAFDLKERTVNPVWKNGWGSSMAHLINTYYPVSIKDLVNGDSVTFSFGNFYSNVMSGRTMYEDYQGVGGTWTTFGSATTDIEREGDEYTITAINFPEGRIEFIKDTAARLDIGTKPLKEIKIYNNRNLLLKAFALEYFYLTSDTSFYCNEPTKRLFLSSVREINFNSRGDTIASPPYVFTYNNAVKLPCVFSLGQDYWGYYNGKVNNTTGIPTFSWYSSLGIPAKANRAVDTLFTQAGVLTSIKYPTGGTVNFEYENNKTDTLVGGLRIRKVTNYDSLTGKALITEYEYKNANGTSSGEVLYAPVFNYEYLHHSGGGDTRVIRLESDAILPLFPNQGSPVLYNTVLEKKKSAEGEIRTRHYFTGYGSYTNDEYKNMTIGIPQNKYVTRADLIGKEWMTEYFLRNSNGSFSLLKKDSIEYSLLTNGSKYTWNVQGAWATVMGDWIVWPGNDPYSTNPMNVNTSINAYKFVQQDLRPVKKYSISYDGAVPLTTAFYTSYDSINGNVRQEKTVNSKGDTITIMYKYAGDYVNTGTSPSVNYEIKVLQDNNIIKAPIEIVTIIKEKDSASYKLQDAILYEYSNMNVSKVYRIYDRMTYSSFVPSYNDAYGFYKDNRYELDQEVTAFDSEMRPKTVVNRTNYTSYIWNDYAQTPTAVVVNASYGDVAYTGFETPGNTSWTISSNSRDSVSFITGRKSYSLSAGNVSKSSLISSTTYIVTYWLKTGSGTATVNSGAGTALVTKGGWTLYSHEVSGVNTITVSGTGLIDELRLYPKQASMTTYSYERLLGLTDQSDAANNIQYYRYDGLGRLSLILDQDKNVLQRICYNYAGQPGNCDSAKVYWNDLRSGSFTKNNCASNNYSGSVVTYSIPAYTYSSMISKADANTQAQNALNAGGQAFANTNGTCTLTCTSGSCSGVNKKCIKGICETGVKVYTGYVQIGTRLYECTYHYEWSDGSWSSNYTEQSPLPCIGDS